MENSQPYINTIDLKANLFLGRLKKVMLPKIKNDVLACTKPHLLGWKEPINSSKHSWQRLCPHPNILIGFFKVSKQIGHFTSSNI